MLQITQKLMECLVVVFLMLHSQGLSLTTPNSALLMPEHEWRLVEKYRSLLSISDLPSEAFGFVAIVSEEMWQSICFIPKVEEPWVIIYKSKQEGVLPSKVDEIKVTVPQQLGSLLQRIFEAEITTAGNKGEKTSNILDRGHLEFWIKLKNGGSVSALESEGERTSLRPICTKILFIIHAQTEKIKQDQINELLALLEAKSKENKTETGTGGDKS